MKMMTAVNTIRVKKGRADEVIARFKTPKSVHTFDGFIRMEVLKKENSEDHDELKVCTTWADQSYFQSWLDSRESKKAHGDKKEQKPQDSSEESPILGAELTTFEVAVQHLPAEKE